MHSSIEQHLRRLEEKLLQPNFRKCAEDVAALLADDFVEFGSSGRVFNKEQMIEALQVESQINFSLVDFKAVLLAQDVALVTYRAIRQGEAGESIGSLRSSIWKIVQGRWQIVFHQGTVIKKDS